MVFPKRTARLLGIPEISARSATRARTVGQTDAATSAKTGLRLNADEFGLCVEEEEVVGEGTAENADPDEASHGVRS